MAPERCEACGQTLPAAAHFCPSCGRPVTDPGGEMLKPVTVLFADVVSSTEQGETRHPEETRAMLGDFFSAMAAEIHAEGGAIEKFIGDAIMAVFGVPAAHEDDAQRAVRAARRMLARLDEWNAGRDAQMQIRIGVNTGDVLASGVAGHDLMVTGDAVNVAARLEHAAPAGGILLGERTAQAVRREFDLTSVGSLALRGKAEPVHAWLVERERETPEPEGISGLTTPMVGRDVELDLLQTLFDRARNESSPQLVTIVGDAGIGKSRLAREFCERLGDDVEVLVGRCLPYGDGVTLWPLAEILKARGSILDTDSADVAFAKVESLVRETIHPDLAPHPERTAAALASTMGLAAPGDARGEQDPRDAQRELRAAWRALIASLSSRRALLIVVEDLHWADPTMLATIEDLVSHVDGPALFVTTARSEALHARPDWGGGLSNYSALRLDPLPDEASVLLLTHLLELEELPIAVTLLKKAEGNPFFLEELLRGLVDSNRLRVDAGRLRATNGFGDLEIPDTVQAVILARIDLLPSDHKRALQLAAVVGRTFWRGAVARLAGSSDDLDEMLHVLQQRGLIRERLTSSVGGEVEFRFRHVLIQEVAYDSVPRRERARAHAEAARWIEATAGARRDELAELLAHHYVTAHGILDEDALRNAARSYCLTAARSAFRRFAIEPAETFAWLAVDLSRPGVERVAALESLADLYAVTMRGDAAWHAYADAIREVQETDPDGDGALARLAARAATLYTRRGPTLSDPPARADVERIVDLGLAAAPDSATRERVELLAAKSFVIALAPRWDAANDEAGDEAARTAVALAEATGDANLISSAIDGVGLRLQTLGLFGDVYDQTRRRLELVPELTDASEICDAYVTGAWSAVNIGLYGEAIVHATRCIEVAAGADEGQYVHGLVWRVAAAFRTGAWDLALADMAEIERHVREEAGAEPSPFAAHAYATAQFIHQLRGEAEAAADYAEFLRTLHAHSVASRGLNGSRAMTVRALVHAGRVEEAERLLPQIRGRSLLFYHEALSDLLAARGDGRESRRVAQAMRAEAPRTGERTLPLLADRLEGHALAAGGDRDASHALFRRAADGFAELGAPWETARSLAALGGDAELERAAAEFERLGARLDAAACRARLAGAAS
jgi:class 3 adenylate cyclase